MAILSSVTGPTVFLLDEKLPYLLTRSPIYLVSL